MAHLLEVSVSGKQPSRPGHHPGGLWLRCGLWLGWLCFAFSSPGATATNSPAAPPAKPRPAKLQISGYGILGNHELKRILRTLELGGKTPESFGAAFVEDAVLLLAARVKRDGYLEPRIDVRLRLADGKQMDFSAEEMLENPLPRRLRITAVRFQVRKGILYYFQSLKFTGLHALSEKEARAYFIETETLFRSKRSRIYTSERLRQGLSSLGDVLDQQGYQEAKVEAPKVRLDRKTGAVVVEVQVSQGDQFIVRSVQERFLFRGTVKAGADRTVYPNHPYSRLWSQDFTLSLKTNQFHLGYPDTTVEIKTLAKQSSDGRVLEDLQANVESGEQVRIGSVVFHGLKRTRSSLMERRVRVQRGDWLDPIRTEEGRARLARLGIFDLVDLNYRPIDPHTRDVIYGVQESKNLTVSLLAGWGSYELLRGGVEADLNNIWGLAHHANVKAVQSFKASSGELTYTIPEVVGRDYDLFLNGSGLRREEVSFTRLEYGGGVGLHKYFQELATDASVRYSYRILNALDFSTFQEISTDGLTNPAVGSITFELKHDRRDNPLYPRKGYKVFVTLETASSYLGGDASFERIELSPSWYHPLGGGRYLSIGLSHGVAVSFGTPANNLPFNSRFFPGGESSIRGYQEGEASPRNELGQFVGAETYTLGTVELEQALTPKWSIVMFSDSLGFARHMDHYPFDTGLFSVGVGLWWRTLIGPVRLEYGHNLNPRVGDPSGTLQFSLGFPF